MQSSVSEIARLRTQIRQEHELKERAKQDPALFPQWFVDRRRKQITDCYHDLIAIVGKPAATRHLYEVFSEGKANTSPH